MMERQDDVDFEADNVRRKTLKIEARHKICDKNDPS